MTTAKDIAKDSVIGLPPTLRPLVLARLETLLNHPENLAVQANPDGSSQQAVQALARIVACSDFITRVLSQEPGLLQIFCGPSGVEQPRRPGELTTIVQEIGRRIVHRAELAVELRRLRHREVARIGWRDLAGWATLEEVVTTLSELADAIIEIALACAHREVADRYGQPIGDDTGLPIALTVFGLGKLGGRELNLSSDVDLIFAYAEPGETLGPSKISNQEFFVKLGQILIAILEEPTADGIVYRTDMRLRPNGDSGPLVLSYDAMDHYYLTHGRDWERYALIKARPVAGDRLGGNQLLETLRPFVYRKYLDFGAIEAIRSMKALIERELQYQDMSDHIKLGRGGIREIEFVVQSHQIIYGGRHQTLQTASIWLALTALESLGIVDHQCVEQLCSAYDFLRRLEHRLQVLDDQQTHRIPTGSVEKRRIATAMNFESESHLLSRLNQVTEGVHQIFVDIFTPVADLDATESTYLAEIWQGVLPADAAGKKLAAAGFRESDRIYQLLKNVRTSRFYLAYSREGRERFDRLLPLVLEECGQSSEPEVTLTRLLSVIETIGRRSAYLSLLAENPLALRQLVELTTASSSISNWIGQHPVILDELLDPITNFEVEKRSTITQDIARKLGDVNSTDLERDMDLLREYRWGYNLRVGAADIAGLLSVRDVSRALSALAEALVEQALDSARNTLIPSLLDIDTTELGIVAYGKLGSGELGYNSDLDIIFVYDQPSSISASAAAERRYRLSRLVQRLVHILTVRTPAGNLYEIDLRLRPDGRSGTVVTPLDAYAQYLQDSAWTWEHQALVRARMICGDAALEERFEAIREDILLTFREPTTLAQAIANMRDQTIAANCRSTISQYDLKLDRGGLVDIEFLVQYWVLNWARDYPQLVVNRDSYSIIKALLDSGLIDADAGSSLLEILTLYLTTENRLKLQEMPPLIDQDQLVTERNRITSLWQQHLSVD